MMQQSVVGGTPTLITAQTINAHIYAINAIFTLHPLQY